MRAVDIARALHLSKATVSLALNDKPGVSKETREKILAYMESVENGRIAPGQPLIQTVDVRAEGRTIIALMISAGMKNIKNNELDLWMDVREVFERNFRASGYSFGLIYADLDNDEEIERAIQDCNAPGIAGVILYATELQDHDLQRFIKICKPMVVYDYIGTTENVPFISINNRQGVRLAVQELISKGNRDIIYFGMPMPMYNYLSRQRGFIDSMLDYGFSYDEAKSRIITTADTIAGCKKFCTAYLNHHSLPEAFLCESYHISIGLLSALREMHFKIPESVSVIGIDQLPDYLTGGINLTCVRVPHTERAYWTTKALLKEIKSPAREKALIYVNCRLIPGDTVKDRTVS